MSRRKQRQQQFLRVRTGWYNPLSPMLLKSALVLLDAALHERRGDVTRLQENHYSWHAVGSIALLIEGLEAWLNERIWSLYSSAEPDILKLADKPIKQKYCQVPQRIKGVEMRLGADLDMVIDVRNEIAHFLPRIIEEGPKITRHVPPWLEELYQRQLFLIVPERKVKEVEREGGRIDVPLQQLLCSYRLAYWAWETVAEAVAGFVEVLGEADPVGYSVPAFERYKTVVFPPGRLHEYDAQWGLSPNA
jgi:hypothetical protein